MSALPTGWTLRPLSDAGHWLSGGTPSRSNASYWGGHIPWISAKSLTSFELEDSEDKLTEEGVANGSRIVEPGTLLFVVRGMSLANEFRVGIAKRRVAFNQDLRGLVPAPDIDSRYLTHFLKSAWPEIQARIDSAAHGTKRLPSDKLGTLEVPLPPLPEQKCIAAILDKAAAIRRKRQQAIRLTEELLRSAFLEMFGDPVTNPKGWEVKKFGDLVADTQLGLVRAAAEQGSDREYEYVRMDSISRDGLLNLCNLNRIDASASEVTKCGLKRGDLLFNTRNTKELVGKTAVYRGDGHHVFNNNIMRVRFRPGVASDYVNRYLLSRLGRRELEKRKAGTTSVFAIYYKQLATLPVLVPPASLQSAYSRAVDHILRTRERGERHGELLVETGNALTQRAFSGRL